MSYRVLIDSRAAGELESLPKSAIQRIDQAILNLAENPRPTGVKRLRGKLRDGWRIRVGPYRVLFRIDEEAREVRVFKIGHRRDIYR
ncbi:MAG TPA: type II toxin-antitoxin system RelE/ParE family toxin [Terriglobia bacterium]|nr:type II toxin-antitoxin system RelE/ParE family toxin [Terriglobia bacterium]